MTVTDTTNKIRENGNGVIVAFDFDFKIFNTSDLVVQKIDTSVDPEVATAMVEGVDYTVAINAVTEGGTVTYTVAPTATEDSFIKREMTLSQETNVPTESNFPEVSVENEFDKSRMIDIQLQEQIDRAVLLPEISQSGAIQLPEPSTGKTIKWTAGGDFENSTYDPDEQATLAAASAAAALVSETNAGVSEDAAAVSAAAAAASAATIDLTEPDPIGSVTPNTGAFTSLTASGLISADGGRVKFPATAVPSADPNTLDDYEEGTWTPTIFLGATEVSSYDHQVGTYTKKGNRVAIQFNVVANNLGAGTGVVQVRGLPFTSKSRSYGEGAVALWVNNLANYTTESFQAHVNQGLATISLFSMANGVATAIPHTAMQTTTFIMGTVAYET